MTHYERTKAKAHKEITFWQVYGCSRRKKNITKRNGQTTHCDHKHKTEQSCAHCLKKMKTQRPGNHQDYRPVQIHMLLIRR